jgi:hypothetical protein
VTAVTLLEKAYGSFSARRFEANVSALCKDLRVKIIVRNTTDHGWIQIEVTGEDEAAALGLLDEEIGVAPSSAEKVGNLSVLRGRVFDSARSRAELCVDIGVFKPEFHVAVIPLWRLQSQLDDGRDLSLNRLAELFCLCDYVPLSVKVLRNPSFEQRLWEAELSELQLSRFSSWLASSLDRLIVVGATRDEVEDSVVRAHHFRDVMRIEKLGSLEHAVLCKLGTDAVGLVPKLGPRLVAASLVPFSPRRIRQVIGRPSL